MCGRHSLRRFRTSRSLCHRRSRRREAARPHSTAIALDDRCAPHDARIRTRRPSHPCALIGCHAAWLDRSTPPGLPPPLGDPSQAAPLGDPKRAARLGDPRQAGLSGTRPVGAAARAGASCLVKSGPVESGPAVATSEAEGPGIQEAGTQKLGIQELGDEEPGGPELVVGAPAEAVSVGAVSGAEPAIGAEAVSVAAALVAHRRGSDCPRNRRCHDRVRRVRDADRPGRPQTPDPRIPDRQNPDRRNRSRNSAAPSSCVPLVSSALRAPRSMSAVDFESSTQRPRGRCPATWSGRRRQPSRLPSLRARSAVDHPDQQ